MLLKSALLTTPYLIFLHTISCLTSFFWNSHTKWEFYYNQKKTVARYMYRCMNFFSLHFFSQILSKNKQVSQSLLNEQQFTLNPQLKIFLSAFVFFSIKRHMDPPPPSHTEYRSGIGGGGHIKKLKVCLKMQNSSRTIYI